MIEHTINDIRFHVVSGACRYDEKIYNEDGKVVDRLAGAALQKYRDELRTQRFIRARFVAHDGTRYTSYVAESPLFPVAEINPRMVEAITQLTGDVLLKEQFGLEGWNVTCYTGGE